MEEEKPQGKRENAKMMYFDDSAGESGSREAGMGNMVYSSGRLKVQSVGFIVVSEFRKKICSKRAWRRRSKDGADKAFF